MSRSHKKVASCGATGGRDALWKRQERQRLRRINKVRVEQDRESFVKYEGNIHNWWCSPSDGRFIFHIRPNPNTAGADEMRWWCKCLRK